MSALGKAYEQALAAELSGRELRELLTDALKASGDGFVPDSGRRVFVAWADDSGETVETGVDEHTLMGWVLDESGNRVPAWWGYGSLDWPEPGSVVAVRDSRASLSEADLQELQQRARERMLMAKRLRAAHAEKARAVTGR